jgi:hypothetical protein
MSQPDFSDRGPAGEVFEPYGSPQTGRSSRGCWIIGILVAAGLLFLGCCGGCLGFLYFGVGVITTSVEDELADNPILREHLGEIESFEIDWSRTLSDEDTFVYNVRGSKGSGRVIVEHVTGPDGMPQIVSAQLRLPSGELIDLMPGEAPVEPLETPLDEPSPTLQTTS